MRLTYIESRLATIENRGSYRGFVQSVKRTMREEGRERTLERIRMTIAFEGWERVSVRAWRRGTESPYVPFLCAECGAVDRSEILRYETVRYRSRDGSLSRLQSLVLHCTACGNDKVEAQWVRGGEPVAPKPSFLAPDRQRAYSLSYTVAFNPFDVRTRGQLRDRATHALVRERATVSRTTTKETRDPSAFIISHIAVDGIDIPQEHQLYAEIMPHIERFERERGT